MATTAEPIPDLPADDIVLGELPVQGMTCAACVRRVEKALRAVDGVADASVNLVTARATVRYAPARTRPAELADAIRGAGYDVLEVPAAPTTSSHPPRVDPAARADAQAAAKAREQTSIRHSFTIAAALTAWR